MFLGVKSKGCYSFKSPHPVIPSLMRISRVRFINETDANIFFKAVMIISKKLIMQRFLFNLLQPYSPVLLMYTP